MKEETVNPPIPDGLCGDEGCVYTSGHEFDQRSPHHSWQEARR